MLVYNKMTDY